MSATRCAATIHGGQGSKKSRRPASRSKVRRRGLAALIAGGLETRRLALNGTFVALSNARPWISTWEFQLLRNSVDRVGLMERNETVHLWSASTEIRKRSFESYALLVNFGIDRLVENSRQSHSPGSTRPRKYIMASYVQH